MGRRTAWLAGILACAVPMAVAADCVPPEFAGTPPAVTALPAAPPDPSLRPALPACLDVSSPNQESCTPEQIAAYGAAVETWEALLTEYVAAANAFANQAVADANAAVRYAQDAGPFADQVVAFAICEADEINRRAEAEN